MSEDSSLIVTLEDLHRQRLVKVNPHVATELGLHVKHTYRIPEFTISGDWGSSQITIPRVQDITDGVIRSELHKSIQLRIDHRVHGDEPVHMLYTSAGYPAFYLAEPRREPAEELLSDRWLLIAEESE